VSRLGLVLFAAGTGWFLWRGWTRRTEPQGYPVTAVSLGIIAVFLLVSKVHSPQYALWVVPFLVLLDVPWWLVLAYLIGDALVFLTGFVWVSAFDRPFPLQLFEGAVFVRAGALGGLAWWAARAKRVRPLPDRGMAG
jgi:hypothetical protein